MKVLFICNEYPPSPHGGIGTFVKVLAERLAKSGIECFVLGFYDVKETEIQKNNLVNIIKIKKNNSQILNSNKIGKLILEISDKFLLSFSINKIVKDNKIDIVESYEWNGPLAFHPRTKLIVRLHGSNSAYSDFEGKKKSLFLYLFEKWNINLADYVISVSRHMLELSNKTFGTIKSPSQIIYNSYNEEKFKYLGESIRDKFKILFVGKFLERKGVFELFHILNIILKLDKRYTFEFIGTCEEKDRKKLLKLLDLEQQKQIFFSNKLPNNELVLKYHEAAILIVPSKAEAFGLIVIEAMACGCVVAMNNIGVATELIKTGQTGIVIDSNNYLESANVLNGYLNHESLLNKIREQALIEASRQFSTEVIINKNISLYKKLCNEN